MLTEHVLVLLEIILILAILKSQTEDGELVMYHFFLFPGLKSDKARADKKGDLKEVATICNALGDLYAKQGRFMDK